MIKEFFEKNKIFLAITLTALIIGGFIFLPGVRYAEARRGCCSWHGGVCGCRCCDGTPLSAKCAPYYPHCYAKPAPKYELPVIEEQTLEEPTTEEPESASTETTTEPQAPKEKLPTAEKFTAEVSKENDEGGTIWWWIIGAGTVAYFFYELGKRKRKK